MKPNTLVKNRLASGHYDVDLRSVEDTETPEDLLRIALFLKLDFHPVEADDFDKSRKPVGGVSQVYVGIGLMDLGLILKYIKEHGLEEKIREES